MRRSRSLVRPALAVVAVLGLAGVAQAYSFFYAAELDRELEQRIGAEVLVVDTLVRIWERQDVEGYIRFDTERFRCAVPVKDTESIAFLREVEKRRRAGDRTPALVAVFGKVTYEPLWGPVKGGEDAGVHSEQVVLLCDKVEQPRARFFDEGH